MGFKSSNLIARLEAYGGLSDEAWAFIDACMDDWAVDEDYSDENCIHYELRSTMRGKRNGKSVYVHEIFYGDLDSMAALIEHLAMVQALILKADGIGSDYLKQS